MEIFNKRIDFFFIKFPILFPLIYLFFLYSFPQFETYLIIFTIFLLAEPHFGATYPIFFDKSNNEFFKTKKIIFYYGSMLIISYCLLGFFFFKYLFLLSFYAFNIFHVTRQSVGICKLYNKNQKEFFYQSQIIYLFNILFFVIGFLRFYLNVIPNDFLIYLNISVLLFILISLLIYLNFFKLSGNFFTLISGVIIFYPICFVYNPIHAILLGVTIHYSQYLFITSKVYIGRKGLLSIYNLKNFTKYFKNNFIYTIIIYSFFMSAISYLGKLDDPLIKNLILIPITGQMLHFYLDSFIWKFSEKHNRENTLKYILEKI